MSNISDEKSDVRSFWEGKPCGSVHGGAPEGTSDYYANIERRRYELEPFIPRYAGFSAARGRSVLEIGVGLGTDLVQFARMGAEVTGVDLTQHAVDLVCRRLELEELTGDVRVADAEALPFADGTFDLVYSWGVLHHTPDTDRAIREAIRVLKPGGRLCVMLYNRRSWVAYGLWVRYGLLRGKPTRGLADVLAHHMESPGTKGYVPRELRRMFVGLDDLIIQRQWTPYDRRVAGPLAGPTGRWLGWFIVIQGLKAA